MNRLLVLYLLLQVWLPRVWGQASTDVLETGRATFYAKKFTGRRTASGERFNPKALTAAHRTLPFGTLVKVQNVRNGKTVVVRINDRGPHVKGCLIDLTKAAAKKLGLATQHGGETVMLQPLGTAKDLLAANESLGKAIVAFEPVPRQYLISGVTYKPDGCVAKPKGYALQVASYYSSESALYDAATLKSAGYKDVFVQVRCSDKEEEIFRVLVGQYPTHDDALDSRKKLAAKGWDSFPAKHM
jgi:rare lipoprotein A